MRASLLSSSFESAPKSRWPRDHRLMLPRLRGPGGRFDQQLVRRLDSLAQEAANARVGTPADQADRFRKIVVTIAGELRPRFETADLRRLIETPGYQSLMRGGGTTAEQVGLEIDELARRLRELSSAVGAELKRWELSGHVLVADTNVFLHHLDGSIAATNWLDVGGYGMTSSCTLVLPLVVLDEIDNHKRSNNKETRAAAKRIAKEIHDLISGDPFALTPIAHGSAVSITALIPPLDHEPLHRNDNEIIDQALQLHSRLGSGLQTKLVTADLAMATQARAAELDCVLLRES